MAPAEPRPARATDRPADLPERRRATEAEAQAIASTVRLRILRLCLDEALTNRQIADRLDRHPATILYHVRRLVDTGFLSALPARRGTRGAREIPYRATGKSWTVDVTETTTGPAPLTHAMLEAFLDELDESGGELADATRLALWLTEADRDELARRLQALWEEFKQRSADSPGERWSVFFAMHRDRGGRAENESGC